MNLKWPLGLFLVLLPALMVIAAAVPRLTAGIALEQAFPESALLMANVSLPRTSYMLLDRILATAPATDGQTRILRAEADVDAGRSPEVVLAMVKDGLSRAPADARGWVLLASLLKDRDPREAEKALAVALELAPLDYYLIVPRTALGAQLWPYLQPPERRKILEDAYAIATNVGHRDDLHALLDRPGGADLVTRALRNNPDGIRKLNRDLAREALHLQ